MDRQNFHADGASAVGRGASIGSVANDGKRAAVQFAVFIGLPAARFLIFDAAAQFVREEQHHRQDPFAELTANKPRPLVSTTGLATISAESTFSMPAAGVCAQRRPASLMKGLEEKRGVAKIAVQQDVSLGRYAADLVAIAGDDDVARHWRVAREVSDKKPPDLRRRAR